MGVPLALACALARVGLPAGSAVRPRCRIALCLSAGSTGNPASAGPLWST